MMMMLPPPTTEDIQKLADRVTPVISKLLAGHHPVAQGAVLADVVATWLAGHAYGDLAETRTLRQQLFSDFIIAVEQLVSVCAEELGTPHDPIVMPGEDELPFRRQ